MNDGVKFLDVRGYDPEGPSMPGGPPGCSGELSPDFVAKAKEAFDSDDTILVMCATRG